MQAADPGLTGVVAGAEGLGYCRPVRTIVGLGALACACGVNPAFDSMGASVDAPASTSTASGSSSSGSAVPTTAGEPGSTGEPTTGGASTGAVAAATSGSTSEPGTTGVMTSSDGTDDTGGPTSCWQMGVEGWAPGQQLVSLLGLGPGSPTLLGDGLSLFYVADVSRRLWRVDRAGRDVAFAGGARQMVWGNLPGFHIDHPALAFKGEELFFHYAMGEEPGAELQTALYNPDNVVDRYSQPMSVLDLMHSDAMDEIPSVTEDGRVLLVQRRDGPDIAGFGTGWQFHQFRRGNPQPGAPWALQAPMTPWNPPLQLALCPALSPDGLHLLYTSTDAALLDEDAINNETGVWWSQRPSVDDAWGPPVEVPGLSGEAGVPCPRAVTSDGCTLVYTRFMYPEGNLGMYISDR